MSCNIMNYEERVDEILAYLKRMQADIDGYGIPTPHAMRALVRHATVPPEFIRSSLTATENNQTPGWSTMDAAEVEDTQAFDRAYGRLAEELGLMQRGVLYAIAQKKAKVGRAALRVYAIARALNRGDKDALVPQAEDMRRDLRSRRRRTRKPDPQPE